MNTKKKLIKSFMGVGLIKMFSIPMGLTISIILARVLGPESYGQYTFIVALIPIIALPVSGGLPQLLTREIASFAHANEWSLYKGVFRASHCWVAIASLTMLIIYWVLDVGIGLVPDEGKWTLLSIAILLVPLSGLAAVRIGIIKGLGMPAYAEIPEQLIRPFILLVFFCGMFFLKSLDVHMAILGQVLGAGLVLLIASWMLYKIQPKEAKNPKPRYQLNRWALALVPFGLLALVGTFNAQIGIIVLGVLGTDEQVAALRIAERSGQFVMLSLTLTNLVISPYIVRAHRDGNRVLLQQLAQKSARGSFLLSLPIALVLIIGGEPLVALAFGEEYADISYIPLVIIAIGQLINVFFGSVGYFLSMSGYERDTLKGQLLAVIMNLSLCILLVPNYGAVGAAIAVSIGILVWNVLLAMLVKRRIGIRSMAF